MICSLHVLCVCYSFFLKLWLRCPAWFGRRTQTSSRHRRYVSWLKKKWRHKLDVFITVQLHFIVSRKHVRDMAQCAVVTFAKVAKKKFYITFFFHFQYDLVCIDFCSAYMGNAIVYLAWWNAFPCGGGNWEASFCKDSRILKEHNTYIFAQSHVFVSNNKQTLIPAVYIVRNLLFKWFVLNGICKGIVHSEIKMLSFTHPHAYLTFIWVKLYYS